MKCLKKVKFKEKKDSKSRIREHNNLKNPLLFLENKVYYTRKNYF